MLEHDIYQETIDRLQQDLVILCRRLGIYEDEHPTLVTSRQKMCDILIEELPYEHRLGAREYLLRKLVQLEGSCYPSSKHKIIFVFVSPNRELVQRRGYSFYRKNLAHELVHYRFWTWNHNKKFDETVDHLLYTSKTWPRTRLYLDMLSDDTAPGSRPDKTFCPG